ncbi:hypothetical protein ACFQFH_16645 [Halobaculum halobium]|uniref:hypothetical protein n=1 Tax=Halobaculum halobium TaxID=3032281 RepID=UPI00360DAB3D
MSTAGRGGVLRDDDRALREPGEDDPLGREIEHLTRSLRDRLEDRCAEETCGSFRSRGSSAAWGNHLLRAACGATNATPWRATGS